MEYEPLPTEISEIDVVSSLAVDVGNEVGCDSLVVDVGGRVGLIAKAILPW